MIQPGATRSETASDRVERLFRNKRIFDALALSQSRIKLARARAEEPDIWSDPEPLVSVRICTYNRPKLLVERAVASVLQQTYRNFELIIVGDHAGPETAEALAAVQDPRIRYVNLPVRPIYPKFPRFFWSTAGNGAAIECERLFKGAWITRVDDDDAFAPDHLESLLFEARYRRLEMVYGKVELIDSPTSLRFVGSPEFRCGHISAMAVMFARRLLCVPTDPFCWVNDEPADWNIWRRMKEAGAEIGFFDKVVGFHYPEYSTVDAPDRAELFERKASPEEILTDLERTGGQFLLGLA